MSQTTDNVQVTSQSILNLANTLLPLIEQINPTLNNNKQTIALGISAIEALLPLISLIPASGLVSKEQQAALYARSYKILSGEFLSGEQWVKQV